MAPGPDMVGWLAGSGIAGAALTKLGEWGVAKWTRRLDKKEAIVESVPALDAVVKNLQATVGELQGLVARVGKHDWRLDALERDTQQLRTQQEMHKRDFDAVVSSMALVTQKLTFAEERTDELKVDIRQLAAKLDAFADRMQNLAMERAKPSAP